MLKDFFGWNMTILKISGVYMVLLAEYFVQVKMIVRNDVPWKTLNLQALLLLEYTMHTSLYSFWLTKKQTFVVVNSTAKQGKEREKKFYYYDYHYDIFFIIEAPWKWSFTFKRSYYRDHSQKHTKIDGNDKRTLLFSCSSKRSSKLVMSPFWIFCWLFVVTSTVEENCIALCSSTERTF